MGYNFAHTKFNNPMILFFQNLFKFRKYLIFLERSYILTSKNFIHI